MRRLPPRIPGSAPDPPAPRMFLEDPHRVTQQGPLHVEEERRRATSTKGVVSLGMASQEPTLEARFESLVATHRDRAVRLAWRLVGGDEAAAEDVTQDAFVSAYRSLDRFRGDSKLDTWFYRILVRQAYSYLRWRKVRERFVRVDPDDALDPAPRPEGDPVLRARIAGSLDSLPCNQRDAFVLVHMEDFTVREAAEIMGKAPGTVKSHLHRALGKLRVQLEDALETPTEVASDDG